MRVFVFVEQSWRLAFFLCWNLNGNDLALEAAFLPSLHRLAMRVGCILILLFARDAIFLGDILSRHAHLVVVVAVPETVIHPSPTHLRISQPVALAPLSTH